MKRQDTTGHSPVVFWYRGKRQGQEQSPSQIEKGRQGVRTWRPFCFHTMGRGAEPQGLFSFHPAPPHCTRARRAGPNTLCPGPLMPRGGPGPPL
nr:MAG TPA: hypothetical protein [Caudoviricetes sp.]